MHPIADETRLAATPRHQNSVRLLVSVRSVDEAKAAFDGGADLIDLKEPLNGPLGAVSVKTASDICDWFCSLGDRRDVKLSLAMGELLGGESFPRELLSRFDFAKVGLAGLGESSAPALVSNSMWNAWKYGLPPGVEPVLVIYADWKSAKSPPPSQVLQFATAGSFGDGGVLIDTWDKSTDLIEVVDSTTLKRLVERLRESHRWIAMAGSLNTQTVVQAMLMRPDIIAVRGAVCDGRRTDSVSKSLVAAFVTRVKSLTKVSGNAEI